MVLHIQNKCGGLIISHLRTTLSAFLPLLLHLMDSQRFRDIVCASPLLTYGTNFEKAPNEIQSLAALFQSLYRRIGLCHGIFQSYHLQCSETLSSFCSCPIPGQFFFNLLPLYILLVVSVMIFVNLNFGHHHACASRHLLISLTCQNELEL